LESFGQAAKRIDPGPSGVSRVMIMRIKMVYDWDKKPRRLKHIRQIAIAVKITLAPTLLTAFETYALVA
jgi:hypothetical protein